MENYICLNGKIAALTDEQLKALGIEIKPEREEVIKDAHGQGYTMAELVRAIRNDEAEELFTLHDVMTVGGKEYEIISFENEAVVFMGKELLPPRKMFENGCGKGKDYRDSSLRKWLNNEYFKTLPEVLRKVITPTPLSCTDENGLKNYAEDDCSGEYDPLFLLSESELFGSAIYSPAMDGARFAAFNTAKDRVRVDDEGDTRWYWTRSKVSGNTTTFVRVNGDGSVSGTVASGACCVPLCFRIS